MSGLARQQQALLNALFSWPPETAIKSLANYADLTGAEGGIHRGFLAYQSNGHELAQRSLLATYPVVAQLLGDESFAALSRALWHAHPPLRGDLAQWGHDLPAYVRASAQLADEPYLADVAQAEWALHICSACADVDPDPASIGLLITHDPAALTLILAPGCVVIESAWPVASILTAHLSGTPELEVVGQKLRTRTGESAVVWRHGRQPRVREALPGEAELLAGLLSDKTLDAALQSAPALDFNAWLTMAAQTGLLLAARPTGRPD